MSGLSSVVTHTDETVLRSVQMFDAVRDYEAMLQLLHNDSSIEISIEILSNLLRARNELVVFIEDTGQLVATAQGTLCHTEPVWQVLVNNVVVHDDHQGRGHGRRVLMGLEQAVRIRWGDSGNRPLKLQLTNSPKKQNGGFYEALGWLPRIAALDTETVVWVKNI